MTIYNIYIYQNCNVLGLDGHLHSDLRMWIVILHLEILNIICCHNRREYITAKIYFPT